MTKGLSSVLTAWFISLTINWRSFAPRVTRADLQIHVARVNQNTGGQYTTMLPGIHFDLKQTNIAARMDRLYLADKIHNALISISLDPEVPHSIQYAGGSGTGVLLELPNGQVGMVVSIGQNTYLKFYDAKVSTFLGCISRCWLAILQHCTLWCVTRKGSFL